MRECTSSLETQRQCYIRTYVAADNLLSFAHSSVGPNCPSILLRGGDPSPCEEPKCPSESFNMGRRYIPYGYGAAVVKDIKYIIYNPDRDGSPTLVGTHLAFSGVASVYITCALFDSLHFYSRNMIISGNTHISDNN